MKKLLVVVDYQNDFVNGALGFAGAEALEPGILSAIDATLHTNGYVLFTRDTHGPDYLETREGKHLPLPHCVEGTPGHALYGGLHRFETHSIPHTMLLNKPLFGCANIGIAAQQLCGGIPDEIEICGLVTDICVIANAVLLHSSFPLAEVRVLENLVGSENSTNARAALDVLRGMGVKVASDKT